MIAKIESLDQILFLWLNSFHNTWADELMWAISSKWLWIPLYALIIFKLINTYKKESIRVFALIILTIALSDGISSAVIKNTFKRYRPSHNTEISPKVHVYTQPNGEEYRGGTYGFVSSHAANSFAIATLTLLFLRKRSKHWRWLFLWAIIVSYSRIYLGVHYPLDIIGGAFIGIAITLLIYFTAIKTGLISTTSPEE